MELTRRLWAIAGLAVGLAAFAVVLDRPLALAGTVLIGAWIVSRQYLFLRATTTLAEELSVTQSPAQTGLRTGETTPTTLTVTLDSPSKLACTVSGGIPTTANRLQPLELSLDPGQTTASMTVDVRWPVAGRHSFGRATLTVADGLFRERIPVGSTPTVTVEPRGPRNVHVGEGGQRIATAYGEHSGARFGSGIEPAKLREYVPGDTADRIDWKATARLSTPYVREYEAETDRKTLLVVDHRQSLAHGLAGETKLDYLREVALAVAHSADTLGDPLGLITVGDEGITERITPSTRSDRYATIRETMLDVGPTEGFGDEPRPSVSTGPVHPRQRTTNTLADVRRALAALEGEESEFAGALRPFYADRQIYLDRIDTDPLYNAVRATLAREQGPVFTVLCTDDSFPTELLETVKLASRGGRTVLVLLTPTVLYEDGGLADIERAYDRYLEFEELRRRLARLNGVTALEVGPHERISTILAAGRDRRIRPQVGGGTG